LGSKISLIGVVQIYGSISLLGVLLKTAEIDPNDMKWQIWKELGQEILTKRTKNKGE